MSHVGPTRPNEQTRDGDTAVGGLDPSLALRPGRLDPFVLWLVWLLRRASLPLLWVGLIGAVLSGDLDDLDPQRFQTLGELFGALLSPLAGVALAIAARAGAGVLGWALAYPIAHAARPVDDPRRFHVPQVSVWIDRFHLTRALRAWRWTAAVREVAAHRLGGTRRRLRLLDRGLLIANPVLIAVFIVAAAVTDGPSDGARTGAVPAVEIRAATTWSP